MIKMNKEFSTGDDFLDSFIEENESQENSLDNENEEEIDEDEAIISLFEDDEELANNIYNVYGREGLAQSAKQSYAYNSKKANGLYEYALQETNNPILAAAIIGNAAAESNFNPHAIHDNNTGYGMFGHRDPKPGSGRKTQLLNYLKQNTHKPTEQAQIDFVLNELQTSYRPTLQKILNTRSPEEAAEIFAKEFERPNPKYANFSKRKHVAKQVYKGQVGTIISAVQSKDNEIGNAINKGFETYKNLKELGSVFAQGVSEGTSYLDSILSERNQILNENLLFDKLNVPIYEQQSPFKIKQKEWI